MTVEDAVFDREHGDTRTIFYADRVPPNGQEMALLQKFELERSSFNLPIWWRQGDTLRFAHTVKLDYDNTKQLVREYLKFVEEVKDTKLSQETLGFIGSGNVYVAGKCKDECTNVYLTFNPKIRSVELNEFVALVRFILFLVRNQTCVPGYLERINLFFVLTDNQSSKAFIVHLLDKLRYIIVRNLPFTVNRFVFLGDTGDITEKYQEYKKKMAPFCEVINYKENESDKLLDIIDEDQLEVRYGGTKPNIVEYWPPAHHTIPKESIDEEDMGRRRIVPFFIYDEDYESFIKNHVPSEVKISGRFRSGAINFKNGRQYLLT